MMDEVKKLFLKSQKMVHSLRLGENGSLFVGNGLEFSELREYQVGDDIKYIDWAISAKCQKPMVKLFFEDKEKHIVLVNLLSGSLHFGRDEFKSDVLMELNAILANVACMCNDICEVLAISQGAKQIATPFKNRSKIIPLLYALQQESIVGNRVDYGALNEILMQTIRQKSVVILMGDFLDFKSLNLGALAKKHEIVALIIRDRFEEHPTLLGSHFLVDLVSFEVGFGLIDEKNLALYAQKLQENDAYLYQYFEANQIRFAKVYTNEDPIVSLAKVFE